MCTNELSADAFWLCFVSMLWGSTNPLIRKGSKGIEDIHRAGRIRQFLAEIVFLASNWKVRRISTSSSFVSICLSKQIILSLVFEMIIYQIVFYLCPQLVPLAQEQPDTLIRDIYVDWLLD